MNGKRQLLLYIDNLNMLGGNINSIYKTKKVC